MAIGYISHHDCQLHEMGHHHPEQPARLRAINDRLIASGLEMVLHRYDAPLATRDLLEAVHDPAYVEQIFAASPAEGLVWVDGDTAMNRHSLNAALRAAGAVALGVDLVLAGQVKQAFCGVRPPGHHAERHRAMGFCLFNNIAVGAYHALNRHALKRVAILDFDVHHGNGTEDIVAGDGRVLFCSTFQHPFYPHSGFDSAAANVANAPLAAGSDGKVFRAAVETHWLPRLEEFAPELILISAGFDAHQADDMAGLNLVDADYAWVTRRLCEQADRSAQGRVVSTLEGGYELHALARSVEAHLKAFLGDN
jgi:acetoin utilization deacetylase AcuC-like enzyme